MISGYPARQVPEETAALLRLPDIAMAYVGALVAAGLCGLALDALLPGSGEAGDRLQRTRLLLGIGALGAALSVPLMRRAQRSGRIGWFATAWGAVQIFLLAALGFLGLTAVLSGLLSAQPVPGFVLLPGLVLTLIGVPVVFLLALVFWMILRLRRPEAFRPAPD
ncbi:MAG: hypothetical protein AAFR46_08460 [Pseudomonadota bacterium]